MGTREDYARAFGENLVVLRKLAGFATQPAFAEALKGIAGPATVGRWERGLRLPDSYELTVIGEVVGATPDELVRPRLLSPEERELLRRGARAVDRSSLRGQRAE